MQRFQRSFNAFIERFQDRWETEPGFRTAMSTVGAGSFLIILCIGALAGTSLLGSFFASAGDVQHASVVVAANGNTSTFPLPTLAKGGNDVSGTKATPVATSTFAAPSPTPTVTPAGATATPTVDPGAPTPTPGSGGGQQLTVTASQSGTWKAGLPGDIKGISTNPAVPNATMTITLQFGDPSEKCFLKPNLTVTLDASGRFNGPKYFTVPQCFTETSTTATAVYHIDGYQDVIASQVFFVQK